MMLAEGYDEVILESDGRLETTARFDKTLELIGPATLKDTFLHTHAYLDGSKSFGKVVVVNRI